MDAELNAKEALGDTQRWNRYAYARNNPLRYVDPDGRDTLDLVVGFGEGVWSFAKGVVTASIAMVRDPIGSAKAVADEVRLLGYGVAHPGEVWDTYVGLVVSNHDADQPTLGGIFGQATTAAAVIVSPLAGEATGSNAAILNGAAKGSGNFGLGSASASDAMQLGKTWVGEGYRIASDGKTLISHDGLRQFRPPTFERKLDRVQANFERRSAAAGRRESKEHLDTDPQ